MNQPLSILETAPRGPGSNGPAEPAPETLIDRYLREQQQLRPVDRFARLQHHDVRVGQPSHYRDLLPIGPPGPGQQYAFEVDLDACSGCKACVAACHTLNGLDDDETWRSVGLLIGGSADAPVMQHVTTACHHCLDPACLNGCPVNAYEKHPVTGIVKHLDDQCIGCQYCILKCPYDVPRYNRRLGIVRKCDMCGDRLAAGEAPACVQSCPNQAIRINVVEREHVIDECRTAQFVPGAPDPQGTLPATHYHTRRVLPRNVLPADYFSVQRHDAHAPLTVMLVLTQLSVGAFVVAHVLQRLHGNGFAASVGPVHAMLSLGLGLLALAASVLHLGRPLYAFRVILGLRTSWLSREIVTFGAFAGLATVYGACHFWFRNPQEQRFVQALGTAVVVAGVAGVACSIMIYHDTRRECWHAASSGTKFLMTALVLGLATTLVSGWSAGVISGNSAAAPWHTSVCRLLGLAAAAKLGWESTIFSHLRSLSHSSLKRSALLLIGPLRRLTIARYAFGAAGGILLPLLMISADEPFNTEKSAALTGAAVVLVFTCTLIGELLERHLFFTAAVAPKMPGGVGAA